MNLFCILSYISDYTSKDFKPFYSIKFFFKYLYKKKKNNAKEGFKTKNTYIKYLDLIIDYIILLLSLICSLCIIL